MEKLNVGSDLKSSNQPLEKNSQSTIITEAKLFRSLVSMIVSTSHSMTMLIQTIYSLRLLTTRSLKKWPTSKT